MRRDVREEVIIAACVLVGFVAVVIAKLTGVSVFKWIGIVMMGGAALAVAMSRRG